jgi:lipopolysaccharide/colanic/teichoic acid biosynthesis glycosyltransferase
MKEPAGLSHERRFPGVPAPATRVRCRLSAPCSAENPALSRAAPDLCASPIPGWKRALDVTCSLLALLMNLVTKMASPGPVLFRQERIGYRGRRFMLYKFRTMVVGADTAVHQAHCEHLMRANLPMVKMDERGDSRLIPGSRLLRASGLDELPQIINVLRGEMSLVGPRPCVLYEFERYGPAHMERFSTLPGLTGLWQVSGKNRTTFDEMIRLDIDYARHKSLWLDLKIMLLTAPALLRQIGDTRTARKSPASAGNAVVRAVRPAWLRES